MEDILFISYFFNKKDGVGALRSLSLHDFLIKMGIKIKVISNESFSANKKKSILLWSFYTSFLILKSDTKKVYLSCGPFIPLLLIAFSCRMSKKNLVLDFRDPWSMNIKNGYGIKKNKGNSFKLWIARLIEKYSYYVCQYFIVCTKGMKDEYENLFNSEKKIKVIKNGYNFNARDYLESKDKSLDKNIKIICLGKFVEYDYNRAAKILEKINILKKRKPVTLTFVGSDENILMPLLISENLHSESNFVSKVDYKKALEIASHYDIGIVNLRDEDIEYGTKVYDYLGLGLSILTDVSRESNFNKEFGYYLIDVESEYYLKNNSSSVIEIEKYAREKIFNEFNGILY